jgi:hypothetical protein
MSSAQISLIGIADIEIGSQFLLDMQFFQDEDGLIPRDDFDGKLFRGVVRRGKNKVISTLEITLLSPSSDASIQLRIGSLTTTDLDPGPATFGVEMYESDKPDEVERLVQGSIMVTQEVVK